MGFKQRRESLYKNVLSKSTIIEEIIKKKKEQNVPKKKKKKILLSSCPQLLRLARHPIGPLRYLINVSQKMMHPPPGSSYHEAVC